MQQYIGKILGKFLENKLQNGNNNILNNFASGIQDFTGGYAENKNNAFAPENITTNQFKFELPNNQLQEYQQSLLNNGYNQDVVNAVADKKNSGFKEIDNWIKSNPQAYQKDVVYKDKGNMARLGEALGTVARIAENPNVQGAVSGILGGALTGNPLYGLGLGYKMANKRANSNMYNDFLKEKYGVETQPGIFGNLSSNDMSNIGRMAENQAWHDYMKANYDLKNELASKKLDETIKQNEIKNNQTQQKINIQNRNADSNSVKANASMVRAKKTGNSKSTKTSSKPSGQFVVGETPSGSRVKVPVERVKEFKSNGGKIVG